MIFQKIQQKRGFSLFELLIYISIFSIIVILVANAFISLSKGRGQSEAKSEVNSAMRFAVELLKQDIKNASSVTTPSVGIPSATLTLTRGGVTITYDVLAGVLRRKEGVADAVNITNANVSVGTPVFTRIENTNLVFNVTDVSIKIEVVFSYNGTSPDWTYSDSLKTTVDKY